MLHQENKTFLVKKKFLRRKAQTYKTESLVEQRERERERERASERVGEKGGERERENWKSCSGTWTISSHFKLRLCVLHSK